MRPSFKTLWRNYPRKERSLFFREIGWDDLISDRNFENTCAIRVSLCLGLSNVMITSSQGMRVLKGRGKGRQIEIRQDRSSKQLVTKFGPPEKYKA
jgi:hypothetical protein